MEPPLGSQPARTRPTATARRSMLTGGPWQAASTSGQSLRSVDPESPGEPREGTTFGLPQILLRLTVIAILLLGIVRHVPAPPAPGPLWADAKPAPETLCSPSASVTPVAFVGPARHRRGRRFPPRQGLGVFRHAWVSGKRSQTL